MTPTTECSPNPHGDRDAPCNLYCTDGQHALVILSERVNASGLPATPDSVCASTAAYYGAYGWRVVRARPAEADPDRVLAQLRASNNAQRTNLVYPGDTEGRDGEGEDLAQYAPWLLIVEPMETKED